MKTKADLERILKGHDIVYAVRVGSQVYGCAGAGSDTDFVAVVTTPFQNSLLFGHDYNVTLYSPRDFQRALHEQSLYALEALHAPTSHRLIDGGTWRWTLDSARLRARVKARSEADYAKGLRLMASGPDKARKKIWHSVRCLAFLFQILHRGELDNFGVANELYLNIMTDPSEDPEHHADVWGPVRDIYYDMIR